MKENTRSSRLFLKSGRGHFFPKKDFFLFLSVQAELRWGKFASFVDLLANGSIRGYNNCWTLICGRQVRIQNRSDAEATCLANTPFSL